MTMERMYSAQMHYQQYLKGEKGQKLNYEMETRGLVNNNKEVISVYSIRF
ncbi:hypothetical protein [Pasteurella phage vB_PmuP_PHB02]|uniref:Uncharacterized protein n=1 Tax=Pasteurella phage vB_PmuP_PHB02 TaxID=2005054 RepID=A0A1Y0SVU6_9CAUD|nr:hypothetical protein HOR82_gp06 [Pasteurella phage vB_PmuP_PHB02]ARV77570.1 hypothetical protein [Pasteurella phage vB_PmuP_PHB02]